MLGCAVCISVCTVFEKMFHKGVSLYLNCEFKEFIRLVVCQEL